MGSTPPYDPTNALHLKLYIAACTAAGAPSLNMGPGFRCPALGTFSDQGHLWRDLVTAAMAFSGLSPGQDRSERSAADLTVAQAEIRRLTAGLRTAEANVAGEREACAAQVEYEQWDNAEVIANSIRCGNSKSPRASGGPSLFREVQVLRRVRLELIGRVEYVRPDGKGRGMEISLERPVRLPPVDDAGPWVRALPPLAGSPDRGRWRVVKWRSGNYPGNDFGGSVVVDGSYGGVVAWDSLWLEVPDDG